MRHRILIRGARAVLPGETVRTSVLVEDGRILGIDAPPHARADEIVDATGLHLLPGVIDDQVHFRDPGLTHKEDLRTGSRACAAGGVTSFLEMPQHRAADGHGRGAGRQAGPGRAPVRGQLRLLHGGHDRQPARAAPGRAHPRRLDPRDQDLHRVEHREHAGRRPGGPRRRSSPKPRCRSRPTARTSPPFGPTGRGLPASAAAPSPSTTIRAFATAPPPSRPPRAPSTSRFATNHRFPRPACLDRRRGRDSGPAPAPARRRPPRTPRPDHRRGLPTPPLPRRVRLRPPRHAGPDEPLGSRPPTTGPRCGGGSTTAPSRFSPPTTPPTPSKRSARRTPNRRRACRPSKSCCRSCSTR